MRCICVCVCVITEEILFPSSQINHNDHVGPVFSLCLFVYVCKHVCMHRILMNDHILTPFIVQEMSCHGYLLATDHSPWWLTHNCFSSTYYLFVLNRFILAGKYTHTH